jgi:VWFA-related protein
VKFYVPVLFALFALPVAAQFSETLEVRVLEIEATVVDRDQNTIEGLTREDFLVTIDEHPVEITNFAAVSRGMIRESAAGAAAQDATVAMPVPTRLIIVVDDLSLRTGAKQRALRALRKYVDETMDASTTATLITWNGALTTRTTPTTRRDLLRSAIDASAREIPRGMAIDAERRQLEGARLLPGYPRMVDFYSQSRAIDAERTIDALADVIDEAARAIEGRKIVLFVSEGIPMQPGAEMRAALNRSRVPMGTLQYSQAHGLRLLAKHAQEAGVIFSTLDPSLFTGMHEGGMGDVDVDIDTSMTRRLQHEGVALLARETGGTLIASGNDLDAALRDLDDRLSTYYSIAVRPPAKMEAHPQIVVRVRDQPKLRVHLATRRGLPSRDEAIANAVRAQLTRRHEENPLHVRLFVEPEQHERGCIASLQFHIPAEGLTLLEPSAATRGQLDLWFAVADQNGIETPARMQPFAVTSRHGATIGHAMPLALAAGSYVVSTAVVDRLSGAMSYLQREVNCGK